MDDVVKSFKGLVALAELGQRLSGMLSGVRFIHETDEETLGRVLRQALKVCCAVCRGTGRPVFLTGTLCNECGGTGERAYDPREKPVREVMES